MRVAPSCIFVLQMVLLYILHMLCFLHGQVEVMGDIYRRDDRHLSYRMPGFTDMMMTYPESVTQGTGVLTLFNDTLFYDLHLLNMDLVLKAFTVKLEPKTCSSATPGVLIHVCMLVVWSNCKMKVVNYDVRLFLFTVIIVKIHHQSVCILHTNINLTFLNKLGLKCTIFKLNMINNKGPWSDFNLFILNYFVKVKILTRQNLNVYTFKSCHSYKEDTARSLFNDFSLW